MKALRVHGFESLDDLRLDDVPVPEPRPGEVRVAVDATVPAFVDLLLARGGYQVRPALPFVAGSEFGGVIEACGSAVPAQLRPGLRVGGSTFAGAWAERICVPHQAVHLTADDVPAAEAAGLAAPFGTAHYALALRGHLRPTETVLVLGAAGSVGHAAVQVAKALGAHVIAGAGSAAKRRAAQDAGADQVVDTSAADWKAQIRAATASGSVDLVVDPVGGAATESAFRCLGWGGRHLVIGFTSGEIPSLRSNLALLKSASLVGVDIKQFGEREPAAAQANLARVFALHAQGRIRPLIARVLPVRAWREALSALQDRTSVGRIALDWSAAGRRA
jgi:NADPH2:quinone reductase